MKIGMFTETWHPQVNGVVASTSWFADELVKQGHEVEIFAPTPGKKKYNNMKVHRFKSFTFRPYPEFRATVPPVRINKLVAGKGFDVIHTHGPFSIGLAGLYAARRNKIPAVTTFHTPLSDYVHYLFRGQYLHLLGQKVSWAYSRVHYNRYSAVITPSMAIKLMLRERGIKAPVAVIPTGIELKRFDSVKSSKSVRKKFGLDGGFVLHTGRLSREKNVGDVLKACEEIDCPLVVTGRGPDAERLKRLAPDNVIFTGFVDDKDLVKLYKEALFSVIASEAETQGLVIIEGMACECPVVGADWLAIPETVVDNRNGLLFRLHDWRELARDVNTLLYDSRLRNRLAKNARKTAEASTIQKRTRQLVGLYEEVAKR
ncbi:MAG: glycosyltransferase [Candidatus Diapherotrites archaeon]|nr:glycosyltransferase [Candidatus Diapherotrites archaeon]